MLESKIMAVNWPNNRVDYGVGDDRLNGLFSQTRSEARRLIVRES